MLLRLFIGWSQTYTVMLFSAYLIYRNSLISQRIYADVFLNEWQTSTVTNFATVKVESLLCCNKLEFMNYYTHKPTNMTCNGVTHEHTSYFHKKCIIYTGRWKCEAWTCGTWKCSTMLQGWKMHDMNLRHQLARVEIARHENARNAIVLNSECCICLSIAEQDCMSRYKEHRFRRHQSTTHTE